MKNKRLLLYVATGAVGVLALLFVARNRAYRAPPDATGDLNLVPRKLAISEPKPKEAVRTPLNPAHTIVSERIPESEYVDKRGRQVESLAAQGPIYMELWKHLGLPDGKIEEIKP